VSSRRGSQPTAISVARHAPGERCQLTPKPLPATSQQAPLRISPTAGRAVGSGAGNESVNLRKTGD
jgi:hypothetical protein